LIFPDGHGVIRQALFNFLAFLKKNANSLKKEYLILFEEPELFLHPKVLFLLRQGLYDIAAASPYQILCSSHSPMMIDLSKPHSSLVRLVKQDDESTKTYQVGDDLFQKNNERKEWVQMINRFNPHVCEAFYADKVLLVEGDTEAIVYRDLLNRFFNDHEIFVLNTGSKTNIPFFQEILTAFNIEHYIIHDTDTPILENGNKNPAWAHNEKIWRKIEDANKIQNGLAKRYVHVKNFEDAHGIKLSGSKDKPLKAYEFVKGLEINTDAQCLLWLKDIVGNKEIVHDQEFIEKQVGYVPAK